MWMNAMAITAKPIKSDASIYARVDHAFLRFAKVIPPHHIVLIVRLLPEILLLVYIALSATA